jgi:alkylated DNA repair protein (DNA oxidative demethylase)
MRGVVEQPGGLVYRSDFITPDEESGLLAWFRTLDLHPVVIQGQLSKRLVTHFGYGYNFESRQVEPGGPLPTELSWLVVRSEKFANLAPGAIVEALITEYPPGATINWHRDAWAFGDKVVGISLESPCIMRFQLGKGVERRVFERILNPRSAYMLSGLARTQWQHSIPPTTARRYSVTFRTLRAS